MSGNQSGSYILPIFFATLLHLLAISLLFFQWQKETKPMEIVAEQPKFIEAQVIEIENPAVIEREKQRQEAIAKAARDKAAREKAAREKKRQDELKRQEAIRKKAEQERIAKEAKAKEQALKKQEAERLAKQQEEAKKAAAEKALKEKQAAEQKAAEEALLKQLAEEQKQEEERRAQEQAQRQQEQQQRMAKLSAEYQDIIRAKVASAWTYPPSVTPDMEVTVQLSMVPTGEVISVKVTQSSGNDALDRSVEQAIIKASPLPVPDDIRTFESNFRNLTMKFRPENASW